MKIAVVAPITNGIAPKTGSVSQTSEVSKNVCRSVKPAVTPFAKAPANKPPVKIVIGSGKESEDVVIKIADLGGGIPRSHNKRIFNYLFTTAAPAFQNQLIEEMESFGRSSPLAGLGYGLPIARLYL